MLGKCKKQLRKVKNKKECVVKKIREKKNQTVFCI